MPAITPQAVLDMIDSINRFADEAESWIHHAQQQFAAGEDGMRERHLAELQQWSRSCETSRQADIWNAERLLGEAAQIVRELMQLDERLAGADKYYGKSQSVRWQTAVDQSKEMAGRSVDYFETLEKIKSDFQALSRKYSEDALPGLIDGIHYYFSSQRKKDYEQLAALKHSASAFLAELEEAVPIVKEESLAELEQQHAAQEAEWDRKHRQQLAAMEDKRQQAFKQLADRICNRLDQLIPDEHIPSINDMTDILYAEYPVDEFVKPAVAAVIKDKFKNILVDESLRFPLPLSTDTASAWWIQCAPGGDAAAAQSLMQAVMFGLWASCPVGRLAYWVIDPENKGRSIHPFADARKQLPELFANDVGVTTDAISLAIDRLNEAVDDATLTTTLLLVFDFPTGFDERSLAGLHDLLVKGPERGIITVISCRPEAVEGKSQTFIQRLRTIEGSASVILQSGSQLTWRGLPIVHRPVPTKAEFSNFLLMYSLVLDKIRQRGLAFPPLVRKLADAADSAAFDAHLAAVSRQAEQDSGAYGKVPQDGAAHPSAITLGSLQYPAELFPHGPGRHRSHASRPLSLPFVFDLEHARHLYLVSSDTSADRLRSFSHHVMWSFLSFFPVHQVHVCVYDSALRGNSVLPFLDFIQAVPRVFGERIHTDPEDFMPRLQRLNQQIDETIQEKFGNQYTNILDYNRSHPKQPLPFTLLVIYDFPGGFDDRSLHLLTNILRNGVKCGVYAILHRGAEASLPHSIRGEEHLEQMGKHGAEIRYDTDAYLLMPYRLRIEIPQALANDRIRGFVRDYATASERLMKQGTDFEDIVDKPLFAGDSSESLQIPIGIGDGQAVINLTLGEGSSHHGLIAGATGSGKSTLLHTLIMSSMIRYSPEQLHLYLMDFKSGTEFKVYETKRLPHIQLLALDAMQEFGESILENLVDEMERRGSLFKDVGQTSLAGYIQASGKPLPRILVIMDEFQILYNDAANRKVAMNCAELTKRIVTEGRAFGIHLLMATQSTKVISQLTLASGVVEQMRVRIGLKCGEDDARYLFSARNESKALAMMKGAIGTAVMNQEYMEADSIGLRVAYCDERARDRYLRAISDRFANIPYALRTFEGGKTTEFSEYCAANQAGLTDEWPVRIHIGMPIKAAPPLELAIDRSRRHNLLICGTNERMADQAADLYMLSALMNTRSVVYCIDGGVLTGDAQSRSRFQAFGLFKDRFKAARTHADLIAFIHEAYDKYADNKDTRRQEQVFIVLKNLQYLGAIQAMFKGEKAVEGEQRDQQNQEADAGDPFASLNVYFESRENPSSALSAGEKLLKLIAEGTGRGIHVVVSSLDYHSVRESMYYGENVLSKFPERMIFALGDRDADHLIDNVSVSQLRSNTVIYTDGVRPPFQLKPHVLPAVSELEAFIRRMLP